MDYTCFIDIETIPVQDQGKILEIKSDISPPANIKKAESREKWLEENADAATAEKVKKTSFDPALGHICTISWAIGDEDPTTAHATTIDDESDVLRSFFGALRNNHRYTFVGHYVGGFDLRFILCRAVVLGVEIPRCLPRDPKPWDKTIFDTMTAWAGARGSVSMDNLCKALSIEGKGDFDGSQVAEAWAAGEHQKIAEYCADDVRRTREIWRRFDAVSW